MKFYAFALVVALVAPNILLAQEDCRTIENDIARLQCYDAQSASPASESSRSLEEISVELGEFTRFIGFNDSLNKFEAFRLFAQPSDSCIVSSLSVQMDPYYNSYWRTHAVSLSAATFDLRDVERIELRGGGFRSTTQASIVLQRGASAKILSWFGNFEGEERVDDESLRDDLHLLLFAPLTGSLPDSYRYVNTEISDDREANVNIIAHEYMVDVGKAFELVEEFWGVCQAQSNED